jgi:hypothetical protein
MSIRPLAESAPFAREPDFLEVRLREGIAGGGGIRLLDLRESVVFPFDFAELGIGAAFVRFAAALTCGWTDGVEAAPRAFAGAAVWV